MSRTAEGTTAAERRRSQIIERVQTLGVVPVSDLAAQLGVSDMTIRRDADSLAENGDVVRLHGALRRPDHASQSSFAYTKRQGERSDLKERIGHTAATFVEPQDTIIIDAGTTAFQVAVALTPEFTGTVITHSLPVIDAIESRPQVKAIVLGGELYRPSRAFVGTAGVSEAKGLRATTLFLGGAAADSRGLYASVDVERNLKKALIDIADRVIVVVDSVKFSAAAPVFICGWEDIDAIITDAPPHGPAGTAINASGVEIILAGSQTAD